MLKVPGKVAPKGGTGKPVDISKLLAHEEEEEGEGEPKADPDLAPGAAPSPMADVIPAQTAETVDIEPPAAQASSTFTVGRTTTLSPTYSSSVSEPSIGSQGDGIFVTNNWGALKSTNNGTSWTTLNPFSTFPDSPSGFTEGLCCDQRVIQDGSRDLIIWLLQRSDRHRIRGHRQQHRLLRLRLHRGERHHTHVQRGNHHTDLHRARPRRHHR